MCFVTSRDVEMSACITESGLRLVEVTTRVRIAVGDSRKTATGIRSDERFRRQA